MRLHIPEEVQGFLPLTVYSAEIKGKPQEFRLERNVASRIIITSKGQGIIRIADHAVCKVEPGGVILIQSGVPFEYSPLSGEHYEIRSVAFGGSQAVDLMERMGIGKAVVLQVVHLEKLLALFHKIHETVVGDTVAMLPVDASELIYALLLEIRRYVYSTRSDASQEASHPQATAFDRIADYLSAHCGEPILLSKVANSFGYSQQHMNRKFRMMYGVTPQQYLQQTRLRKSVYLLNRFPDMPVQEVARHIGMDTGHFIRTFRQQYGLSPGKMRTRNAR